MLGFGQRNQQFGTLDLVMLIVLCGAVSTAVGAGLTGFLQDPRPARAQAGAEVLAHQLRERHEAAFHSKPNSISESGGNRAPASVEDAATTVLLSEGELGRDPWGHPYHYFVRPSVDSSGRRLILVWSDGANGRAETDTKTLVANAAKVQFVGDDIGFSLETKP